MRSTSMPGISSSSASATAATSCVSLGGLGEATATSRCVAGDQAFARGVDPAGKLVAKGGGGHQRFCSRRSHQRIAMASGQQMKK